MIDRNLDIKKQLRKIGLKHSKKQIMEILRREFVIYSQCKIDNSYESEKEQIKAIKAVQRDIKQLSNIGIEFKDSDIDTIKTNGYSLEYNLPNLNKISKKDITPRNFKVNKIKWVNSDELSNILECCISSRIDEIVSTGKTKGNLFKIKKIIKKLKNIKEINIFESEIDYTLQVNNLMGILYFSRNYKKKIDSLKLRCKKDNVKSVITDDKEKEYQYLCKFLKYIPVEENKRKYKK